MEPESSIGHAEDAHSLHLLHLCNDLLTCLDIRYIHSDIPNNGPLAKPANIDRAFVSSCLTMAEVTLPSIPGFERISSRTRML